MSVKTQKLKSTIRKRFIAISVCYFKIVFVSLPAKTQKVYEKSESMAA